MYRSIYIPVDNSAHALKSVDLGIAIARRQGAQLTGSHVYAAGLHDRRFRQMESGLPERYLEERTLIEQRDIHDDLITRGLRIISDSYLDVFGKKCEKGGVPCRRVSLEGRNWQRLVEDIRASDHDLVIMGALGLGAVGASMLGSVCERVARRIDRDLLVVRSPGAGDDGPIVVAVDGSSQSFGALRSALELARIFDKPVEAVSAFDPFFHHVAFHSIAGVLSDEAARVFRFREQERLHEEIIDSGLARIYQAHLDLAAKVSAAEGVELRTTLLAGKAFEQILRYARERKSWLIAMGRTGSHSDPGMDLGSTSENLLRLAECHVLLSARTFDPPLEQVAEISMAWTREAEARMERVPQSVRGIARRAVVKWAARRGHTMISSDVIDACLEAMIPPGAKEAMAAAVAAGRAADGAGIRGCPFADLAGKNASEAPPAPDGRSVAWDESALARLNALGNETVRTHARLRIEKLARRWGASKVTVAMVAAAEQVVAETLSDDSISPAPGDRMER